MDQHYPPGTQEDNNSFSSRNPVMGKGKELEFPEGRGGGKGSQRGPGVPPNMDEIKTRSKSWNIGDYRTENMKQNIQQTRNNIERLIIVMDEIRNFRPLTEEMLENIDKMDEGSKMIILREYNRVLSCVVDLL
jgi:hypothetical protein